MTAVTATAAPTRELSQLGLRVGCSQRGDTRRPPEGMAEAVIAALKSSLEDGSALSGILSLTRLPPLRAASVPQGSCSPIAVAFSSSEESRTHDIVECHNALFLDGGSGRCHVNRKFAGQMTIDTLTLSLRSNAGSLTWKVERPILRALRLELLSAHAPQPSLGRLARSQG
jgi:hypothetical protein